MLLVCYDYLEGSNFFLLIFVIFEGLLLKIAIICRKNMSCYIILNNCNHLKKLYKNYMKVIYRLYENCMKLYENCMKLHENYMRIV